MCVPKVALRHVAKCSRLCCSAELILRVPFREREKKNAVLQPSGASFLSFFPKEGAQPYVRRSEK